MIAAVMGGMSPRQFLSGDMGAVCNADLLKPALIAGQGLTIQPEFLVWRQLRNGKLVADMPEWAVMPLGLHLVLPPSPLRPLRVQVLIDHLARELAKAPWSGG